MLKYKTYAENVRVAMKTKENAQRRPLRARELAVMSGFSYEHIRKLLSGKHAQDGQRFSVSRECNDIICEILGLDAEAMWRLAEHEKFTQRTGFAPLQLSDPEGRELSSIWDGLSKEQHRMILQLARNLLPSHHQPVFAR